MRWSYPKPSLLSVCAVGGDSYRLSSLAVSSFRARRVGAIVLLPVYSSVFMLAWGLLLYTVLALSLTIAPHLAWQPVCLSENLPVAEKNAQGIDGGLEAAH